MTATQVVSDCLPALNAADAADLVFWTEDALYDWLNDALKRASADAPLWVNHASAALDQGTYQLPADHQTTLAVAFDGAPLAPASVGELEALDIDWTTRTGTPRKYVAGEAAGELRVYPKPTAAGALDLVYIAAAPTVSALAPTFRAAEPLRALFALKLVGAARGQEGDAQMIEMAAHAAELRELYARYLGEYWGEAL